MIALLKNQLLELEKKLLSISKKMNTCITTCLGIGEVLGTIIVSEIGDISRLSDPKKLVAFVGVDPSVKQSGEFLDAQNRMSKRGSPHLPELSF